MDQDCRRPRRRIEATLLQVIASIVCACVLLVPHGMIVRRWLWSLYAAGIFRALGAICIEVVGICQLDS